MVTVSTKVSATLTSALGVAQRLHRAVELGLGDAADEAPGDAALAVEQQRGRRGLRGEPPEAGEQHAGLVVQRRVGHRLRLRSKARAAPASSLMLTPTNCTPSAVRALGHGLEVRRLGTARRAPGRPEVQRRRPCRAGRRRRAARRRACVPAIAGAGCAVGDREDARSGPGRRPRAAGAPRLVDVDGVGAACSPSERAQQPRGQRPSGADGRGVTPPVVGHRARPPACPRARDLRAPGATPPHDAAAARRRSRAGGRPRPPARCRSRARSRSSSQVMLVSDARPHCRRSGRCHSRRPSTKRRIVQIGSWWLTQTASCPSAASRADSAAASMRWRHVDVGLAPRRGERVPQVAASSPGASARRRRRRTSCPRSGSCSRAAGRRWRPAARRPRRSARPSPARAAAGTPRRATTSRPRSASAASRAIWWPVSDSPKPGSRP